MAIYGIGCFYGNNDKSKEWIEKGIVKVGWSYEEAPDLYNRFTTIKAGDIVYLKSTGQAGSKSVFIKGIGIVEKGFFEMIKDVRDIDGIKKKDSLMLNIKWKIKDIYHQIDNLDSKMNDKKNTLYEEFHPVVIKYVITELLKES